MDTPASAREKMCAAVSPLDRETVDLDAAWARTLATAVVADRDQPPFRASAMDGYAVRKSDLAAAVPLKIIGVSAAGNRYVGALGANTAVRIFTGAPVPDGADCVVPQEAATVVGESVLARVPAAENIREYAIDFSAGARLIEPGVRLDGISLALAAAAGQSQVAVARQPKVALLVTGSELVAPGSRAATDQIFDSVSYGLMGLIRAWGGLPVRLAPQADAINALRREARKGLEQSDLLVIIGGASVGDHDLAKPALEALDLEMIVSWVAIKPGKPTWFARTRFGPVLGLPGNPVSALVCAYLFLRALVARMLGRPRASSLESARARVLAPLPPNGPLEHYLRGVLGTNADGLTQVQALPQQDTSVLSALSHTNALIKRAPDAPAASVGDMVDTIALDRQ